jgi:hypothetical protein
MAYRLGDYVISGIIDNRTNNRTYGSLMLRGGSVRFELAGNCGPDIRGKKVRFWCGCEPDECASLDPEQFANFQWEQIGATGTMTTSGWVRHMPCSVEEFILRKELGEPPPTPWVRRVYIEWYGQNGRVVVEMANPMVEQRPDDEKTSDEPLDPDEIWIPLPNLAVMPESALADAPPPSLGITRISMEEGKPLVEHWVHQVRRWHKEREKANDDLIDDEEMDEFPDAEDSLWDNDEDSEDVDAEAALMEELLMDSTVRQACFSKEGDSLVDLTRDLGPFPPADTLAEAAAETLVKVIVARLALYHIAVDICEHCTWQESYRIITGEILPEGHAFPGMIGTGWVYHFSTGEYCKACDDEAGDRAEKYAPPEYDDDDVPF